MMGFSPFHLQGAAPWLAFVQPSFMPLSGPIIACLVPILNAVIAVTWPLSAFCP